jgi:hypothetical protein
MLEFIVLGKIPGTNIQVTLAWFVLVIFGLVLYVDLKFHNHNYEVSTSKKHKKSSNSKKSSART